MRSKEGKKRFSRPENKIHQCAPSFVRKAVLFAVRMGSIFRDTDA